MNKISKAARTVLLATAAEMGPNLPAVIESTAVAVPAGWDEVGTESDDSSPRIVVNDSLKLIPSPKEVIMTFPLTSVSNTYVGAMHEGKEIWFDKKALISFDIDTEAKSVTIAMVRSKAVRRKLIQAAA